MRWSDDEHVNLLHLTFRLAYGMTILYSVCELGGVLLLQKTKTNLNLEDFS